MGSILPVSSLEEALELRPEMEKGFLSVYKVAEKTQQIWNGVYDKAASCLINIEQTTRKAIGSVIRDVLFFPIKLSLITRVKAIKAQLQIEEDYSRDFWDPAKPLDPNLLDQAKIREMFNPPEDKTISITLKNGKQVEVTYRVIQTKATEGKFYNFGQIQGLYGTISNNILATYPYLSAYLKAGKEAPLPPARFIVMSANNFNFKPETLDEAGYALLKLLEALKKEFVHIDQLLASSLGTVFLSNALKQVEDPSLLPASICFDRGPTSLWEASKKYLFGVGSLFYVFIKYSGWASNVEKDIVDFYQKWTKKPSIVVAGTLQDHHFSGPANLCLGEEIKKITEISRLVFDPPIQMVHEYAHHNLRADYLHQGYLVEGSMRPLENLPEKVIRNSLKCC